MRNELEKEIEKWEGKLDKKLSVAEEVDDDGRWILENARAYRKDSEHFFEEGDLIQSFESLVWAWAFVEIGENLDHIRNKKG